MDEEECKFSLDLNLCLNPLKRSSTSPAGSDTDPDGSRSGDGSSRSLSPDSTSCTSTSAPPAAAAARGSGTGRSQRSPEERRQAALVACRNRRGAESGLLQDLGQVLPVTPAVLKSCDKLAVLRLATSYLKLRAVLESLQLQLTGQDSLGVDPGVDPDPETEGLLLRDGFLIIMSTNGEIVYLSDNATGALQCEKHTIIGSSVYDLVDESDHAKLDRLLMVQDLSTLTSSPTSTGFRFKTPRESVIVHLREGQGQGEPKSKLKGATCRGSVPELRITGKVFLNPATSKVGSFFVGVVEPPNPVSASLPLLDPSDSEFPFPHFEVTAILDWVCTADMRVVRFDLKMGSLIPPDHEHIDMSGMSAFEFIHPEDLGMLQDALKSMFKHGQFQSRQGYRMLARGGGWAWFMTQASTMQVEGRKTRSRRCDGDHDQEEDDRQATVTTFCVGRHFMISDVFDAGQPLAAVQMRAGALQNPSGPSPGPGSPAEALPALTAESPEIAQVPTPEPASSALADDGYVDSLYLDLDLVDGAEFEDLALDMDCFAETMNLAGSEVDWLLDELAATELESEASNCNIVIVPVGGATDSGVASPSTSGASDGTFCPDGSEDPSPLLRSLLVPSPSPSRQPGS